MPKHQVSSLQNMRNQIQQKRGDSQAPFPFS
jgi:hypothetical protein